MHDLKTFDNGKFISLYALDTILTFMSSSPTALRETACVKRIRLIIATILKTKYFYGPSVKPY